MISINLLSFKNSDIQLTFQLTLTLTLKSSDYYEGKFQRLNTN